MPDTPAAEADFEFDPADIEEPDDDAEDTDLIPENTGIETGEVEDDESDEPEIVNYATHYTDAAPEGEEARLEGAEG